ncbi:MAG: VWA domain-containing protein [Prevotellaceae bacterium]|nr:VWA domain-containing protein [Prevotellaceae bacterium]
MVFSQPKFFWLLLIIPVLIAWYIFVAIRKRSTLQMSSLQALRNSSSKGLRYYLQHAPFTLRCLALTLFIATLTRPQSTTKSENIYTEGIDITLSLDISGSMLARDFKPDRLQAAKDIGSQFIAERPNDRIGLVVFAGESFTQCPLTTDRITLINLLKEVECGMIEDGTAIGNGLATAVSRLKSSKSVSRVVILLTDGVNNRGEIAPLTAAEIAKTYGIRVYTIGIGTIGSAPYPIMTPFGVQIQNIPVEIDEDMLRQIAEMTDGRYFRATSNTKLIEIYNEINKLEKAKVEVDSLMHYREEFAPFALLALACLLVELFLRLTVLKRIP